MIYTGYTGPLTLAKLRELAVFNFITTLLVDLATGSPKKLENWQTTWGLLTDILERIF